MNYSDQQELVFGKIILAALILTFVFQLAFEGGFALSWLTLVKFMAFFIVILISYRKGEKDSDKEWLKHINKEKDLHKMQEHVN